MRSQYHHHIIPSMFFILFLCCSSAQGDVGDKLTNLAASLPNDVLAGPWSDFLTLVDAHKGDSKSGISKLKSYFSSFGYLNASSISPNTTFDEALESAVKLYQQNFRLPVTGNLDSATLAQIVKPRCGGQDIDVNGISEMLQNHTRSSSHTSAHFLKRYSFFPGTPRWESKHSLTYAFDNSKIITTIPRDTLRSAFRRGFDRWAAIVPLNFTEVTSISRADIVIEFASFGHGDTHPFDGQLGVLAHAFSPEDGRFHLDASETWAIDLKLDSSLTAIHLESVVTHEIGHLIGLGHSGDDAAIMYPSIAPRQVKTEFGQDDIDGAQALYGPNPSYVPGVPVTVGTDVNSPNSSLLRCSPARFGLLGLLSSFVLCLIL